MSRVAGPAATRRTALGGALGGALVVAACDSDEPSSAPSPTASPTSDDPDRALVDEVLAELVTLIAFTEGAAEARPKIAPWPEAFELLHRAHRAALSDDGSEPPLSPVRGTADDVVRQVTRREQDAQRRFADWAVAAESGALARLLASMSASLAQRLSIGVKATR